MSHKYFTYAKSFVILNTISMLHLGLFATPANATDTTESVQERQQPVNPVNPGQAVTPQEGAVDRPTPPEQEQESKAPENNSQVDAGQESETTSETQSSKTDSSFLKKKKNHKRESFGDEPITPNNWHPQPQIIGNNPLEIVETISGMTAASLSGTLLYGSKR